MVYGLLYAKPGIMQQPGPNSAVTKCVGNKGINCSGNSAYMYARAK